MQQSVRFNGDAADMERLVGRRREGFLRLWFYVATFILLVGFAAFVVMSIDATEMRMHRSTRQLSDPSFRRVSFAVLGTVLVVSGTLLVAERFARRQAHRLALLVLVLAIACVAWWFQNARFANMVRKLQFTVVVDRSTDVGPARALLADRGFDVIGNSRGHKIFVVRRPLDSEEVAIGLLFQNGIPARIAE